MTDESRRERSRSRSMDDTGPKPIVDMNSKRRMRQLRFSSNPMQNFTVHANDLVAIKIRGLPYRVKTEQIEKFFGDLKFVRDSILIGELEGGRRTGLGCLLFESEDEAEKALDKDREFIGNRWIQLS